jgi:hypothetical protein
MGWLSPADKAWEPKAAAHRMALTLGVQAAQEQ